MESILLLFSLGLSIYFIWKLIQTGKYLLSIWILYVFIEIIFGLISKEILADAIGWKSDFSIDFLLIYTISLISIYLSYSYYQLIKKKIYKINNQVVTDLVRINKIIIILLIPFVYTTLKIISITSGVDSVDGRRIIVQTFSGLDFVVFKFGFIIIALVAMKKGKMKIYDWGLFFFIIFSFSLYGGRFLIFSGIALFLLILFHGRIKYKKIFRIRILIPLLIIFITSSVFIANTRYFMSNNYTFQETLRVDLYLHTAFRQLGGNWHDFSRVQDENVTINLGKHFFPTVAEGFLPSSIRNAFFNDFFKNKISYGKYFSETIYDENNSLRMNFTNEIYFSFGYFGVVVYSLLLGRMFFFFEEKLNSIYYPISLFFLIQVMSTHILGINTFSNSILLMILVMLIFKNNKLVIKRQK